LGALGGGDDVPDDIGVGVGLVATGVLSSAGQPYRDASAVAKSPPARRQPTTASTLLFTSASPTSTGGSNASTEAEMPTLRS
jgi:hypothetical protein